MSELTIASILVLSLTFGLVSSEIPYYWRQFTGDIPRDAVSGGQNINQQNLYIGRAYLHGGGVVPIEIKQGQTEFFIIWYGLPKTTHFVEILCGIQNNFQWIRANSRQLQVNLLNHKAVIGGYHDGKGFTNIGRIHLNGQTKIGKIDSWYLPNALFYCVDNKKIHSSTEYEVLVYKEQLPVLDARFKL